jgi:AraC-like DNA-binding protein
MHMPHRFLLNRQFSDLEEFAETAREWDVDFRQLDRGRFRADLLQVRDGPVMLARARFSRRLRQSGAPPRGFRTFAIPADSDFRIFWRGQEVTGQQVMTFPRGGELEAASAPGFHVFTLTLPEDLIAGATDELGLPDLDRLLSGAEVVSCDPMKIEALRQGLARLCEGLRGKPESLQSECLSRELTEQVPHVLLRTLSGGRAAAKPLPRKRDLALKRAEALVAAFPNRALTVRDLCRAGGVSERTLEYAFLERFRMTPKAYLQAQRLNGVHRDLLRANPAATRTGDVANRWGFWHLGQFAADYRKFFGELPSQTLRHKPQVSR